MIEPEVFPVEVAFVKRVQVYVEAETPEEAARIIKRAALDMDVMDAPGSDYDERNIKHIGISVPLHAIAESKPSAVVWRDGERWPWCEEAESRWASLEETGE